MDKNSDGKIDIRDLKIVNEKHLAGEDRSEELESIKAAIFAGGKQYQAASVGADALLTYTNPVGRPTKVGNAMYLEPSASNFTMTGDFSGDVSMIKMSPVCSYRSTAAKVCTLIWTPSIPSRL